MIDCTNKSTGCLPICNFDICSKSRIVIATILQSGAIRRVLSRVNWNIDLLPCRTQNCLGSERPNEALIQTRIRVPSPPAKTTDQRPPGFSADLVIDICHFVLILRLYCRCLLLSCSEYGWTKSEGGKFIPILTICHTLSIRGQNRISLKDIPYPFRLIDPARSYFLAGPGFL